MNHILSALKRRMANWEHQATPLPFYQNMETPDISLDFLTPSDMDDLTPLLDNNANFHGTKPKAKDYWLPFEESQKKWILYLKDNCGNWAIGKLINNAFHYYAKPPFKTMVMAFLFGLLKDNPVRLMWIYIVALSMAHIVFFMKDICRTPRPFWLMKHSGPIEERSFSFPSGHTADISAFWCLTAAYIAQPWAWILYICLTGTMMVTRMAKGVHWPTDVIVSSIISPLIVLPLFYAGPKIWLNHIRSPKALLIGTAIFCTTSLSIAFVVHFYCVRYLPLPSVARKRLAHPDLFKRTNVKSHCRNIAFILGFGCGIACVWNTRCPNASQPRFHYGLFSGLTHLSVAASAWLMQNFFRTWVFETSPWTFNDYLVKIAANLFIGFGASSCNLLHINLI